MNSTIRLVRWNIRRVTRLVLSLVRTVSPFKIEEIFVYNGHESLGFGEWCCQKGWGGVGTSKSIAYDKGYA